MAVTMALLRILSGVTPGKSFELSNQETLLGRDMFCDVSLPLRTVSRQHARILKQSDGFFVEDLESVNGTSVNGRRIDRRVLLKNQDQIRIHDVVLLFYAEHEAGSQNASDKKAAAKATTSTVSGHAGSETMDQVVEIELDNEPVATNIVSELDARTRTSRIENIDSPWVKLRAVIELTKNLGSTLSQDEVLPRILDCLFQIFPQTERGYILQNNGSGEQLEPVAIKHRNLDADTISPIGGRIVTRVMTEATAFLSSDADDAEHRKAMAESVLDEGIRSVMCAPLLGLGEKPLGVIHIETNDPQHPYIQRDLDVLVSVGNLAGRAAEAAKMHETILTLDRQKRELAMARDVQLHFLPQQRPAVPGYQFYDFYRAADQVAGDYYDYIELPDGRFGIAMGDVAGKGVSAALLMARLCSEVRYCLLATTSAATAVERLNRQLWSQLVGDRFVTLVLYILDPKNHQLSIVNAGHAPPLHRRLDKVGYLAQDEVCMPLGVDRNTQYLQHDTVLEPGDLVVTYTDGVNESLNTEGQFYGFGRVNDVVARTNPDPVHVGQALVADVQAFSKGRRQNDDVCLLCFARRQ